MDSLTKILKIFYIILVISVICIPVGLMKWYIPVNGENRQLAKPPEGLSADFGSELDAYLEDNFAFRDRLVTADSVIKSKVFKMSGNDKVVSGKEGWLFFGEDIDDLTAKSTMCAREIGCIKRELELINEYVADNNGTFLFMIVPNKASLYSELLPYYYIKSKTPNNKELLETAISDTVEYMDPTELFNSQEERLYHKLDSHWNNKGALLVVKNLMDKWGLSVKSYATPTRTQDWDGDLYTMLYPLGKEKDYQYNYEGFEYTHTKRFKSVDDMVIATENKNSANGSILMFRDSFGRSMLPFVADNFSVAELRRAVPYDFGVLEQKHFDYVVLEIVERNLNELLDKAPHLTAKTLNIRADNLLDKDSYAYTCEYNAGECHIYGKINQPLEENAKIYVVAEGKIYEAFPCYEKEKGVYDYSEGNGFSLYINADKNIDEVDIFIK